MGIIQNFNNGLMDDLRSITYPERGTVSPYVVKDIKNPNPNPLGLELNKRIDDTSRIAQMLIDKPGLKWIGNQTLLSQAELASKAKAAAAGKKTGVGKALAGFAAAAGQVLKIVGSTVAQVPVNGTGTHFVRGFTPDTYIKSGDPNGLLGFLGLDGESGAPKALNGETIILDNTGQRNYTPSHSSNLENRKSKFKAKYQPNDIAEVSTGVKTTEEENPTFTDTERTTKLIDYRKLKAKGYNSNTYSLDYSGYSSKDVIKETRVGLGNQGKKKGKIANYTDTDEDRQDKVNSLDVKKNIPSPQADPDFVQLSFEIITPENTYFIQFRAFLETFSDAFAANWETTKYIGRAEDFYTYNGFSRQVSIGFKIAAATRSEMLPIYNKINTLASVTAPTYGGTESKFMRGTIARVTVGDYLYNVPGIIDTVDFSWQKEYPWEINAPLAYGEEDTMPVLPHILDCSLNFKPIHDFVPESGLTTFISNNREKSIS